jgi:hypothetical protein
MRPATLAAFAAVALLGWGHAANAEVRFATLDRVQRVNQLGLDTAFTQLAGSDDLIVRTDAYVLQSLRNFGVYGQLPISHHLPGQGDGNSALGNIEIGAFFPAAIGGAGTILRLGLVLPTARAKGRNGLTLGLNIWPRITDYINQVPDSTGVRLSISPIAHSGAFFFRGDFGGDYRLGGDGEDGVLILRANLGVGVRIARVKLTLEMTNVGNVEALDDGGFAQTLGVGIAHGILQASVVTVLEDSVDAYIFTIGLCARQQRFIGGSGRWR